MSISMNELPTGAVVLQRRSLTEQESFEFMIAAKIALAIRHPLRTIGEIAHSVRGLFEKSPNSFQECLETRVDEIIPLTQSV